MEKRNVTRPVSHLDVAALLLNVIAASKNPDIGHGDANRTKVELLQELNVSFRLSESLIESALWSCNMLHERGEFSHPAGISFPDFAKALAGPDVFDFDYGYFRDRRR